MVSVFALTVKGRHRDYAKQVSEYYVRMYARAVSHAQPEAHYMHNLESATVGRMHGRTCRVYEARGAL